MVKLPYELFSRVNRRSAPGQEREPRLFLASAGVTIAITLAYRAQLPINIYRRFCTGRLIIYTPAG